MKLPGAFSKDNTVNVIIETPGGCRNKYAYDEQAEIFEYKKSLPQGTSFPVDFGFIPGTKAADGDPMDVLVLMDEKSYPGCLVRCRVIGIIEAEQQEKKGKKCRNDRLLAIPAGSHDQKTLTHINDLDKEMLKDIIDFFEYYNKMEKRKFIFLGTKGPKKAMNLIQKQLV